MTTQYLTGHPAADPVYAAALRRIESNAPLSVEQQQALAALLRTVGRAIRAEQAPLAVSYNYQRVISTLAGA
ncbi:hypothetical protein [Saccharopolyspora sp. NPDC002686]|uniref:hypothetical protein n=1 Tax=Saccharopolyspora sp. NPDC002686 TaxID=3154541 RepID=UPI00332A32D5